MEVIGFQELGAYKKAKQLAKDIFEISKGFPKSETYSLTDQIRRSSRSICANFTEAFRMKIYKAQFIFKLTQCDAECSETLYWIDVAKDCNYITEEIYQQLKYKCEEVGKLLGSMIKTPDKYL
jgi:four helix bundle protein